MITIRIPKEIREYKEKLLGSLTVRQSICCAIAFAYCVPLYLFGSRFIDKDLLSYLIMIVALPCAAIGFFKKNGLPFEKYALALAKSKYIFPAKRMFRTENCYRNWEEKCTAFDEAQGGLSAKKTKQNAYQASLERSMLLLEAEKNGEYPDAKSLNSRLITVYTEEGSGGKAPKKGGKMNKKDKHTKSLLEQQAESIRAKQQAEPHYLISKHERQLLVKWAKVKEQRIISDIESGKKGIDKINRKMIKRRKLNTTIPRTTQQTIPFVADYVEGLFEVEPNKYSKMYLLKDINYSTAQDIEQENIFIKYGEFISYFSEDMNIQICVDNRVISMKEQEDKVFYKDTNDGYDMHRREYNRIMKRQLIAGNNDIQQTKYISVTIDCDSPYEALLRFHKIDAEVISNLKKIGSVGVVLSTDERLSLLHDKFRKGHEGEFQIDYDFIKQQGISSKDYIAPTSFYFDKKYFMIDNEYYRCLYLNNLPASLSDEFLSELVDQNFPLITTLSIQPVAQTKALKIIRRQQTGMEKDKIDAEKKAIRAGYSPETINHNIKQSLSQAEALLDDMENKNQKMFFVTITVMVHGTSLDNLESNVRTVTSTAGKYSCTFQCLDWQQEDAFKLTLPCGYSPKHLSCDRALTTEATAVFMPFTIQELFQPGGFYYGVNQKSRKFIMCNRTEMKTPSGFILGSSGSGKSFATKREILNVFLNDNKTGIIIIDPENEYSDFARVFGGTVIKFSSSSPNYLNPFDMPPDYGLDDEDDSKTTPLDVKKDKALKKKSELIMSIVERMLSNAASDETIITPQQKTIIDRCVSRVYQEYLESDFNLEYLPTFVEFQNELDKEKELSEQGQLIAEGVEYFTRGNMDIFAHKTNVDYNNRLVVFNTRDLGDQLKPIAHTIMFDFIWNRLIENSVKGVRTYCYCDEIHIMFATYYSAYFLRQLYKRGRKFGLVITGITQDVEDLLKSEMARGMISNSNFIMMLDQSPDNLAILADMLHLSETQQGYVSHATAGNGLLFAENVIVPFEDKFPSDSYLYTLMSTKFGEEECKENIEDFIARIMRDNAEQEAAAAKTA